MNALLALLNAAEYQEAFNRRMRFLIRVTASMSIAQVLRHHKHKHFGDLIYFWIVNDYSKKKDAENQHKVGD